VSFEYPLKGQSSVLVDLGDEVPGGVGDNNSIVAYSVKCQHMGCDVQFVSDGSYLLCPCHQSKYDPAREGNVIQGVAQAPLPRIELEIDGDDVVAVGVDGLIYGYRENLAPGEAA
jgi:arsenite oxidase small subunit